jgi:ABC-type multidrug transport system fused ATPase/permease subunit
MLDQTDRVVFVEDGRVVADGTHRELLPRTTATAGP